MENKMLVEVRDLMKDRLEEYKDCEIEGAEVGYLLLERENSNGTHTYSTLKAKKWITNNFDDLGDIVDEISSSLGSESIPNVFSEPERFQVVAMLEIGNQMLSKCSEIETNWNNKIVLTEDEIDKIKQELDMLDLSNGLQGLEYVSLKEKTEDYEMGM